MIHNKSFIPGRRINNHNTAILIQGETKAGKQDHCRSKSGNIKQGNRSRVTEQGGHMAPVTFFRTPKPCPAVLYCTLGRRRVKVDVGVLKVLRRFFCMPFGGGSLGKEVHPAHGEAASAVWKLKLQPQKVM